MAMPNNINIAQAGATAADVWNATYYRVLGDPQLDPGAVKIVCGPERHTFYARKERICRRSQYFRAALTHGFQEAHSSIIELDPEIIEPHVLKDILSCLHGSETLMSRVLESQRSHHDLLKLYRQGRYLQVDGMTEHILQHIRTQVNIVENHLERWWYDLANPMLNESLWKPLLTAAQVAFRHQHANANVSDDCEAIREIYMDFLRKNTGQLMGLGDPFVNFMATAPHLSFNMMKDAFENKDRSILNPKGFSSICHFCGSIVGGNNSFFILVPKEENEIKYICCKVACRRKVKKDDL